MRRTLISAAAAAGITTFAATGLALAQEKQDQQTPETQRMEKGPAQIENGQHGPGQAQRQKDNEAQEQRTPQAGPSAEKEKAQSSQADAPETRPEDQTRSGQANATRTGETAAAVGKVQISSATATRISKALMSTAPATSRNINVPVHIGAPLPGDAELLPLPPAVISLVPEYQGFEYVVVKDQVAIVQPSTRLVVEIITPTAVAAAPAAPPPVDNRVAAAPAAPAVVKLTDAQQQLLVEGVVQTEGLPPQGQVPDLVDGQEVPQNIELTPVPSAVVAQVPMIGRYRLAVANNRVVLVDPNTRVVVHVVR
jgi:hypothetical protein